MLARQTRRRAVRSANPRAARSSSGNAIYSEAAPQEQRENTQVPKSPEN